MFSENISSSWTEEEKSIGTAEPVCFLRNALSVITLHNFILFRNFLLKVDNQFRSQSTIMHSYKAPAHYLLNDKTWMVKHLLWLVSFYFYQTPHI